MYGCGLHVLLLFCGLQECNQQLEVVEKGLNQFLETKKMAFPRCGMPGDAVARVFLMLGMLSSRLNVHKAKALCCGGRKAAC
jgi:hypothetical protein